MKRLLCIAALVLSFAACKKDTREELLPTTPAGFETPVTNRGPQPIPPYVWSSLPVPINNPGNDPDVTSRIIQVNGNVFCFRGPGYTNPYKLNTVTKQWQPFTDVNIDGNGSYLFSYQSKIYYGINDSGNFESVDVTTGVRTVLPGWPGTPVNGASKFVIGDKGYIMGGVTPHEVMVNQFWEFNFLTNQWTNKGNSPLGPRCNAAVFVADGKAYMGLGFTYVLINGLLTVQYKNDWNRWDPAVIYYPVLAPFPGEKRSSAKGFVLNNTPYVGFGWRSSAHYTDLWRYNVSSNTWTQQASWPGVVDGSSSNIGTFSIGNTGYLVKGKLSQFWKFSNSLF